jgi:hypothetical protein
MRIALPIMITIALASPALSQTGGTINRRHVVGCRDSDVYDRIISMISAGNREAATALIARMLGRGECIIWDEGQRVTPQESGSLMSCWAKVSDTGPCYWTGNEHIAK